MTEERNVIPQILTGIACIFGTVGVLWYYGYLHFARPEDVLELSQFTMLKTVPGEDDKVALEPAAGRAMHRRRDGAVRHPRERPDRRAGQ